ncbi:MAG: hypothetical protein KJ000_29520 [Pirellulaceae bacterium]|nr:hypothetical protein [Pirellulaceae bacterium]
MDNDFDPYYKWLGIPPRDQPPNHYRLLGIELFESDRDVIDAAANRVMGYLKDLAVGDEAQHSQKLLNEVARARLCLLNRQKKVDYDAELRAKTGTDERHESPPAFKTELASEPAGPPPSPPPLAPSRAPVVPALNLKLQSPAGRATHRQVRTAASEGVTKEGAKAPVLLIAVVAVVLLAGMAVGALILFRGDKTTTISQTEPPVVSGSLPTELPSEDPQGTNTPSQPDHLPPDGSPNTESTSPGKVASDLGMDPRAPDVPDSWPHLNTDNQTTESDTSSSGTKTAPLVPDWGGTVPEPKPSSEPAVGDLPNREDFIDPTMPEEDPAKPKPNRPRNKPGAEVDPDNTSADEPRPASPIDGPFRDLANFITLPPNEPSNASPTVLGSVHLGAREPCFIKLRGGDKAVRGAQVFSLRNANGGTAERDWEILLSDGGTQTKVAHLSIDAAGDLGFRWERPGADIEVAGNLCNCALVLNVPGNTPRVLALRAPVRSESLVIDLEKSAPKSDLRIDSLPDPSVVYLEIVGVGGSAFEVKPAPVFLVEKGEVWLTVEEAGGLLVLKIESSAKRGIVSLEINPHVQFAENAKPEVFVVKKMPQVLAQSTKAWQALQLNIQGITQALNQNLPGPQRQALQQNLAALQQQEKEYQDYLQRLNQLQTFLEARKSKVELQVRVFRDADTSQIDMFVANSSPDES